MFSKESHLEGRCCPTEWSRRGAGDVEVFIEAVADSMSLRGTSSPLPAAEYTFVSLIMHAAMEGFPSPLWSEIFLLILMKLSNGLCVMTRKELQRHKKTSMAIWKSEKKLKHHHITIIVIHSTHQQTSIVYYAF